MRDSTQTEILWNNAIVQPRALWQEFLQSQINANEFRQHLV